MGGSRSRAKSADKAPSRIRKRVQVVIEDEEEDEQLQVVDAVSTKAAAATTTTTTLKRAHDGSAFTHCEGCNKHVAVALMDLHNCVMEAKITRNLDVQMAELKATVVDKKKTKSREPKSKKVKKAKDPNAPKRPPTAFFVFMDEFRKTYKEEHPDCKSVATVAKEGGEKWKSLTEEEKKLYVDKAKDLKVEYEKALKSYDNNAQDANVEEGSEEKKTDVEIVPVDDDE